VLDHGSDRIIISMVWIDPRFRIGPEPRQEGHVPYELRGDQARAMNNEPSVETLFANR
jgi:hypothetical protein